MTSELRVFGGVDVVIDGHVVDLGHARQRCVLALLVAQADEPVSADDLVDRVWGEHAPPRSRDALYNYISRLRAALATAPDVAILRDTRGVSAGRGPDLRGPVPFPGSGRAGAG